MHSETTLATIRHDSLTRVGFALGSAGTSSMDGEPVVVVAMGFSDRVSSLAFSNEACAFALLSSFAIFARPANVSITKS